MTPLNQKPAFANSAKNAHENADRHKYDKKTWQGLFLFLAAYFIIWSIAPAFLATSVPLDVSEGISWGSEWQWGYYKHPPLSSWVLYSFYEGFGHIGPYLLSQLCVLLTLVLVYKLGRQVWDTQTALLGSVLTLAVVYYSYPSLEFNHNVAQFPIWAGLYLAFYHAITRNQLRAWLLVGVVGGIGMLTKYTVIFLLLPMAIYLLLPRQWPLLKTPKPWVAAAVMLAIFAPHLYWLITHEWLPLTYASGRAHDVEETANTVARHFAWVGFIIAQLIAHIPLIVILALNRKRLLGVRTYQQNLSAHHALLWYLWAAPIALLVVLSLVFGIGLRDMWGMPMWALSGLLAASFIVPSLQAMAARKVKKAVIIWLVLATVLSLVYVGLGDKIRHKPSRMQWPEQALAMQAQDTWRSLSACPIDSVSGDRWLTALVAINNDHPSQMISGPASHSPWMNIARLQTHGTLVLWQEEDPLMLPLLDELSQTGQARESFAIHQGQWQLGWRDDSIEPLTVNWMTYVPKSCVPTSK